MTTSISIRRRLTCGLLLASASLAFAQMPDFSEPGEAPKEMGAHPPVNLMVNYSVTGSGTTEFRGGDRAESGAESVSIMLGGAIPLGRPSFEGSAPPSPPRWMIPLGLASQNIYFDEVSGAPVPESVHTLGLNSGLSYRVNNEWMVSANLSAALYRTSGISGDDVGVSGGVMAMWRYSPSLTWMFGLMAAPDSEFPVLPMVGVNWTISPEFTLSLMAPRPQFIYRVNKQWSLHAGANLNGAIFRTSDTFGTARGEPRYNHALASYRDIRLGAGFEFKVGPRLVLEAEGGYSVNRQIEYTRIDERVKFDPAPYFQVGLRARF